MERRGVLLRVERRREWMAADDDDDDGFSVVDVRLADDGNCWVEDGDVGVSGERRSPSFASRMTSSRSLMSQPDAAVIRFNLPNWLVRILTISSSSP